MRPISSTAEFIVEGQRDRVPRARVAPEAVNFYITQDTQKHILAPVLRSGEFQQHGVFPHNSHKSGTRGLAVPTLGLFEDI
jgi:hypothetical protein